MSTDLIEQVKDGVAVLTLNRPDRLNAMSRPMLDALLEALPRLAEDPAVGVVVLTGAGRGFCAGGDVKAMAEGNELGGQTMEERAQALRARMETVALAARDAQAHHRDDAGAGRGRRALAGDGLRHAHRRATPRASAPPSRASATPATSAAATT